MSDSDGHSLHPLASCAGRDLRDDRFSTRNHISQRDRSDGAWALPANGHAADQSARVIVPPLRRSSPTPLLGAVKGYVAGSKML